MSLDEKAIRKNLKSEYKNIVIFLFDTIDSTNDEAKRLLKNGEKGIFAVISDEQTAGRGRGGHSFYSPSKTGIYLTLVTSPDLPLDKAVRSTAAAAVAVCEAIENLTDKKPLIKWVNDIFVGNKKVCGILTEAVTADEKTSIVTGIGINVSTADFPDEISLTAGSINAEGIDRNILIAEVINRFLDHSKDLENEGITDFYRSHSLVLGRQISFEQNRVEYTATAVGIGNDFSLTVELPDGSRKNLRSGEISVKV